MIKKETKIYIGFFIFIISSLTFVGLIRRKLFHPEISNIYVIVSVIIAIASFAYAWHLKTKAD